LCVAPGSSGGGGPFALAYGRFFNVVFTQPGQSWTRSNSEKAHPVPRQTACNCSLQPRSWVALERMGLQSGRPELSESYLGRWHGPDGKC